MKVTFLGTGTSQGVPVIACECAVCKSENPRDKRLRSSILIEDQGIVIVVDTGPDFRQQMLRIGAKTLDAIVFTHEHKDHIAGLDDIRAFNYFTKKKMQVYATPWVQAAIRREFAYIFDDYKYPGIPELDFHTIENKEFAIEKIHFTPIEVFHLKMPVFGYRIGDFTYITDAKTISKEELEKVKGTKILVLNALRRETHASHFTLAEALEIVEIVKPEKAYFTHISHQLGKHDDVELELPANVKLAYDGLELES